MKFIKNINQKVDSDPKFRRKWSYIFNSAFFLIVLCYCIILFLAILLVLIFLLLKLPEANINLQVTIYGGIFAVISTIISALFNSYFKRKQELILKQYDDKRNIYFKVINALFILLESYNEDSHKVAIEDFTSFIKSNRTELFMYCSKNIIGDISTLLYESTIEYDQESISQKTFLIIKHIKKELGDKVYEMQINRTFKSSLKIQISNKT
jgi:membrane protein implicated in regulation of membrane protease activity